MPPAMTDMLDIWAANSQLSDEDCVPVDFLLPTGIYIQMDVPREATIQHIKLLLWKQAQAYPLFSFLGEMESHMFECVNQSAVHEELEDETRRLCDVRPFLPVLKLVTRNCGRAERLLDSKIGVLIGKGLHELDALQDQEVKDFRSKMFRISEENMQRVQMMTWMEWLHSCFAPQLESGGTEVLQERLYEGTLKVTMHFDQSQDTVSLKVAPNTTPSELTEQAVRKWLTTHGPEEEKIGWSEYVLRVSGKLEFLFGEHPLVPMKGLGTDEAAILQLLTARSNGQRQQIKAAYKTLHGKDLVDDLKSELGGKFETLIVGLMTPPIEYDATQLRNAIKGAGTDEKVLIEILATRSAQQVKDIIKAYKEQYNHDLEEDITGDTSGHFKRMMVVLLQASRQQGVDESKVNSDAEALFAAGEKKFGTDEETFITILGNRSAAHLRRVFAEYMKLSGYEIEETIKRETSVLIFLRKAN